MRRQHARHERIRSDGMFDHTGAAVPRGTIRFSNGAEDRDSELKGRRLGADDYVAKPVDFEILAAIIDARLGKGVRNEVWSRQVALNDRELECLTWSARGKTSPEIATIVGLSKRTVNFHIENACRKLNVSTRTEAVVKATSGRLIDP